MEEIFKPIPNFDGYEISNYGRVISYKSKKPREMTINKYSNGYCFVSLSKNGIVKSYLVHRLVMMTFKPIENMEQLEVNHLDCNRENNHLDNLEWVTSKENKEYRDKLKHTPKAKTIEVTMLKTGEKLYFNSMTECAEYYGITRKAINKYLQTDTVRSDRKVQATFRIVGSTYELNKN